MNYDVGIYYYLKYKKINLNDKYVNCDYIINLSSDMHTNISIENVKKKFPKAIIVHKKPNYNINV